MSVGVIPSPGNASPSNCSFFLPRAVMPEIAPPIAAPVTPPIVIITAFTPQSSVKAEARPTAAPTTTNMKNIAFRM